MLGYCVLYTISRVTSPSSPAEPSARAALDFHAVTSYWPAAHAPSGEHILMGVPPALENPFVRLDPSIEPLPYKTYTTLPRIELPRELPAGSRSALEALAPDQLEGTGSLPNLRAVARLALFTNGLLNRQGQLSSGRVVDFRTAGATGARYHLELYFVCADLAELGAGVYHYASDDHTLRPLRLGDWRSELAEAAGAEPSLLRAPLVAVLTSTFWRNAYTYKARAYRHTFWDSGTTLANFIGVAAAMGYPTRVVIGFADHLANRLLGVDGERESAIALCSVGQADPAPYAARDVPPIDHPSRPISAGEVVFPAMMTMHAASRLDTATAAAAWRANPLQRSAGVPTGSLVDVRPLPQAELPRVSIEEVILARRSTRHYDTATPLAFKQLSTLLSLSATPFGFDCLDPEAPPLHDAYVIVNSVAGLQPGAYLHRVREGTLELLRAGDFRATATHLAVNQAYAGDAHVNVYYLADLGSVLARYGSRGYRLAQLEAALYAGRFNLAAHALDLGGVGSTSYDDEVVRFFSPHAAGKHYLFVTVAGVRRRRARLTPP
jgi:SagB-type dehydrogenase family enzyme